MLDISHDPILDMILMHELGTERRQMVNDLRRQGFHRLAAAAEFQALANAGYTLDARGPGSLLGRLSALAATCANDSAVATATCRASGEGSNAAPTRLTPQGWRESAQRSRYSR